MTPGAVTFEIDAGFPGGNVIVDGIGGSAARVRQDWSTSTEWWFYWCFRVRRAAGRKLRFHFTDRDVFTSLGPCYSEDLIHWRWLGREAVHQNGFAFSFPPGVDTAYFAVCPIYVQSHLDAFLASRPQVRRMTLTKTETGRSIERVRVLSKKSTLVVPVAARTHACEAMGNYVLEGMIDFWIGTAPEAGFLREHVDLEAFPFIDKDGVELGEPGKHRAPHDHNRDYKPEPIYAATKAFMELIPNWRGRIGAFLDLHCPWIREGRNEQLFFVGVPDPLQAQLDAFSHVLSETQKGELIFNPQNNIPLGEDWNHGNSSTMGRFVRESSPGALDLGLEIPYALAGSQTVTPENARLFGQDVARALAIHLRELI